MISKNNNLLNKSKAYENKNNTIEDNIFSDFYLIAFIVFIALCFIGLSIINLVYGLIILILL